MRSTVRNSASLRPLPSPLRHWHRLPPSHHHHNLLRANLPSSSPRGTACKTCHSPKTAGAKYSLPAHPAKGSTLTISITANWSASTAPITLTTTTKRTGASSHGRASAKKNRWREAGRQIAEENSSSIRIHYNYNELKRIPAEDFAACWLGYIDIAQGGYYQFKPQGGGLARIILDRHLVSDGHAGQAPPQLWLEPGRYLLEVEYLNYHHTAEYALGLELASTRRTP